MRANCLLVVLGLGAIIVSASCTRSGPAQPPCPDNGPSHSTGCHSICDAIESADALLAGGKMTWGEPRQILRTGSNWYRIEYESGGLGTERVVLVDPADGHAEFPLRR